MKKGSKASALFYFLSLIPFGDKMLEKKHKAMETSQFK